MIEFADASQVTIEYECTINIGQFENLKPKVTIVCSPDKAAETLEKCRLLLKQEYKKIKNKV